MRADRARELDVDSISDLIAQAGDLTLGIEADFQIRPLDGLQPLTARYGMEFGALDVVPLDERGVIYDKLLDAEVDVGEVYTTEGQNAAYELGLPEGDLSLFQFSAPAPLVSTDRHDRPTERREGRKRAGEGESEA